MKYLSVIQNNKAKLTDYSVRNINKLFILTYFIDFISFHLQNFEKTMRITSSVARSRSVKRMKERIPHFVRGENPLEGCVVRWNRVDLVALCKYVLAVAIQFQLARLRRRHAIRGCAFCVGAAPLPKDQIANARWRLAAAGCWLLLPPLPPPERECSPE